MVDAYESDKLILDIYGDLVSFKRRRDVEDKDEEPSAGSNWGSKRRRDGKELESTSAPKEKTSKKTGKSTEGSKSHHKSAGESAQAEEPMHTAKDLEEPAHQDWESARDVYSKRRIIVVTKLQIVEWHGYKHLDWITICRDDDNLYTFKEGDFKRLRLQDIEDMLILLVQGKLTNLNVEEHKKNKLMRIDELHKFSDGTLDDVRTARNDYLKGIRMEYLPQTIWRQSDRERAAAMI
ncbi:hypothetical protein Tco_1169494 [Tanacetum coccineum]